MMGELLTRWTIRIALLLYAAVLAAQLGSGSSASRRVSRWLSTVGLLFATAHVAAAFHHYHGWSHASAHDAVLRETRELTGLAFGGGIYFNYAFLVVWLVDVVWQWLSLPGYYRRPRWIAWTLHGYLLLIAINGAIVFEAGMTRVAGILVGLSLVALAVRRLVTAKVPKGSA